MRTACIGYHVEYTVVTLLTSTDVYAGANWGSLLSEPCCLAPIAGMWGRGGGALGARSSRPVPTRLGAARSNQLGSVVTQ